jgi:hypothetical protein
MIITAIGYKYIIIDQTKKKKNFLLDLIKRREKKNH